MDTHNRYARQIIMSDIGTQGQQKILDARVLVIGAGGLGSPILLYLSAMGVGTLGVVDFDTVDVSNLQRQIIHSEYDVGRPKVQSAHDAITAINGHTTVHTYRNRMDESHMMAVAKQYDIIVDATDNFTSRYAINRVACTQGLGLVSASLQGFLGQVMSIFPHKTACYQCVFPTAPNAQDTPTCETAGVLGSVAGIIGTIQATEVLKMIVGVDGVLYNKILLVDTKSMDFRTLSTSQNPVCPCCGDECCRG